MNNYYLSSESVIVIIMIGQSQRTHGKVGQVPGPGDYSSSGMLPKKMPSWGFSKQGRTNE